MEKLKMQTTDVVDENIRKIGELFPNCLTERLDENGRPQTAIDFDQLRQELSKDIVEGPEERYQFTWPDKRNAIRLANAPTTDTLRPCREESVDFDNTQNLYIEGDNLEVLKLLRQNYLGKVKMIYIDPPYNTGNDFVYNDDFAQSAGEYVHNSGQEDEEGNRLVANTESNGRFHTDWLNMIYPRLKVAKDLLSEDGVIFISIDDVEIDNLRKVCDEVFGNNNFLATLTRRTKAGGGSAARHFAIENDFILVYAKKEGSVGSLFAPFDEKYAKRYAFEDEIGKYFWDTMERSCTATVPYKIEAPDGTLLEGKWFRSEDRFMKDLKNGEVRFLKKNDGTWSVQFKQRMAEGKKIRSILGENEFKSNPQDLDGLKMSGIFSFPKPVYLIRYLVQSLIKNNDILLDFFSGSATTAHAVMQLNAENGGNRKFIMVQLPEPTDEKSEAYKAGYKSICEIGKERIRRAGKKIKEDCPLTAKDLDTGFRVLKLDSSNMNEVFYTPEAFTEHDLFEDNIKGDRTDEDLLFQTMIELGIELSAKIEKKSIAGKMVWSVSDGYLMACFDKDVNETTIKEIAKAKPFYFVMRDSSMATDNVADNFEQIWSEYSKDTIRRIL
ncbi:site-specific DNA-methyltransferase [Prevotella communis]|uniref:site-specific DNA-methyltransferase n=1 Tax=Prevotella communis TaxID=2913614 RepID=UPI001EDA7B8D|nr:site-specific DNA-methyltransferase [Prevotella communis]UKK58235.1 site-specific DNA-methyltransferase [Prevotella communis]